MYIRILVWYISWVGLTPIMAFSCCYLQVWWWSLFVLRTHFCGHGSLMGVSHRRLVEGAIQSGTHIPIIFPTKHGEPLWATKSFPTTWYENLMLDHMDYHIFIVFNHSNGHKRRWVPWWLIQATGMAQQKTFHPKGMVDNVQETKMVNFPWFPSPSY